MAGIPWRLERRGRSECCVADFVTFQGSQSALEQTLLAPNLAYRTRALRLALLLQDERPLERANPTALEAPSVLLVAGRHELRMLIRDGRTVADAETMILLIEARRWGTVRELLQDPRTSFRREGLRFAIWICSVNQNHHIYFSEAIQTLIAYLQYGGTLATTTTPGAVQHAVEVARLAVWSENPIIIQHVSDALTGMVGLDYRSILLDAFESAPWLHDDVSYDSSSDAASSDDPAGDDEAGEDEAGDYEAGEEEAGDYEAGDDESGVDESGEDEVSDG
jgi:hypothetical protein